MHESQRLVAELGHIQSFFEGKAGMTVGQGKMLLLNWANVARDAAAMLKEQEPVKPVVHCKDPNLTNGADFACSGCGGSFLHKTVNFCPWCGRRLEWDETD